MNQTYKVEDLSSLHSIISRIYQIKNIENNKRYIGKSIDIYRRWKQHFYRNRHSNKNFHDELFNYQKNLNFQY